MFFEFKLQVKIYRVKSMLMDIPASSQILYKTDFSMNTTWLQSIWDPVSTKNKFK